MIRRGQIVETMLSPSLAQFKTHIRITTSDMDSELTDKLEAAILAAEHQTGRKIAPSNYTYEGPFQNVIVLDVPVLRVESVSVDGAAIQSSLYRCSENRVMIADGVTGHDIQISFIGGMGIAPADMQAAILLHAASLFNNPVDSVEALPKASQNLLRPYRIWK